MKANGLFYEWIIQKMLKPTTLSLYKIIKILEIFGFSILKYEVFTKEYWNIKPNLSQ
jgi:hypothetical protein